MPSCTASSPGDGTPTRGGAGFWITPMSISWSSSGGIGSPANVSANACANTAWSAREEHSAARSAKNDSTRDAESTAPSARCAPSSSPMPTRAPPARIRAASSLRGPVTASRATQHSELAHAVDVLAHLQRDAERALEVDVAVEREERPRPGDRLPHARQLVELLLAQLGHGAADALGDRVGHAGEP